MSTYYGIVLPAYFTGATGRGIRKRGGKDAQLLGLFLLANEWMNMLGLYKLRLADVRDIIELTPSAALRAYHALGAEQYAFFDEASSFVWVKEMARIRLSLGATPLAAKDKRAIGAERLYCSLAPNEFLGAFYDRYGEQLRLRSRREGPPLDVVYRRGFEGASKGLPSPLEGASKPVSVTGSGTETGTTERSKQRAARAPSHLETVEVQRLVNEAVSLEGLDASDGHLVDVVRSLCTIRQLPSVSKNDILTAVHAVREGRLRG